MCKWLSVRLKWRNEHGAWEHGAWEHGAWSMECGVWVWVWVCGFEDWAIWGLTIWRFDD